jgi:hypothetical protein
MTRKIGHAAGQEGRKAEAAIAKGTTDTESPSFFKKTFS